MHTQNGTPGTSPWTYWTDALEHEARRLVEELDAHPTAQRLFRGNIDADSYIHYLVQTYHYVRWSTPILTEAGHRMKRLGRHLQLGELLLQKATEERGHERWLLADLKNLGWPAGRVESATRSPAVTAYIAWNCYTARSSAPTAFLGTAFVLEYLSVQRAGTTAENLVAANTIPNIRKAVTFLRGHGAADEDHVAELTSVLRSLTDVEEQAAIILSARTTRALYIGFFDEKSG
ncbi:iron-containing redox enzyme family protein [Archangium violaceum]|uniref:iron-containing redox enzyme family protein n=1 Tax=Archangium violaceum TaxID=83451 RepID=UPI002B2ABAC1|nr:iron-containing redox enzyme family protein [Archangium violaceum]